MRAWDRLNALDDRYVRPGTTRADMVERLGIAAHGMGAGLAIGGLFVGSAVAFGVGIAFTAFAAYDRRPASRRDGG